MKHHANEISALRVRIASLNHEQRTLQEQTRSRSEVASHVEQTVAGWDHAAQQTMRRTLHNLAHGHAHLLRAEVVDGHRGAPGEADLGPMMVALLGAQKVASVLLSELHTVPEGLPKAPRLARLEAIAAELLKLETEEERLISEGEDAGTFVPRRRDARPEIVLALSD